MVVAMQRPGGEFCALQLTYLTPDGSGKAAVDPQKRTLGPMLDSAVRLGPAADNIIVVEGVETGLSIITAGIQISVWASLGAKRMRNVVFPDIVRNVIIAADRDDAGITAARLAAGEFRRRGLAVRITVPPVGHSDFNDLLLNEAFLS